MLFVEFEKATKLEMKEPGNHLNNKGLLMR